MSDVSQFQGHKVSRHLLEDEKRLIRVMLEGYAEGQRILDSLDNYIVEPLKDGSMGSVRCKLNEKIQKFGKVLAKAEFLDTDDVPVSVVLNIDTEGQFFELDIWKVDFSALIHIPSKDKITLLTV